MDIHHTMRAKYPSQKTHNVTGEHGYLPYHADEKMFYTHLHCVTIDVFVYTATS